MRADDVTEQRFIVAARQAVRAGFLMVGPAGRQIAEGGDFVINDGVVAKRRPDDAIAALAQQVDQILEPLPGNGRA